MSEDSKQSYNTANIQPLTQELLEEMFKTFQDREDAYARRWNEEQTRMQQDSQYRKYCIASFTAVREITGYEPQPLETVIVSPATKKRIEARVRELMAE